MWSRGEDDTDVNRYQYYLELETNPKLHSLKLSIFCNCTSSKVWHRLRGRDKVLEWSQNLFLAAGGRCHSSFFSLLSVLWVHKRYLCTSHLCSCSSFMFPTMPFVWFTVGSCLVFPLPHWAVFFSQTYVALTHPTIHPQMFFHSTKRRSASGLPFASLFCFYFFKSVLQIHIKCNILIRKRQTRHATSSELSPLQLKT